MKGSVSICADCIQQPVKRPGAAGEMGLGSLLPVLPLPAAVPLKSLGSFESVLM